MPDEDNCITNIENILTPHIGKFGIALSLLGGTASVLLGLHIAIPASIVMGITNVGIFAGGLAFERIQKQNEQLNNDCVSQKEMIRKLTISPNFNYNCPDSETPQSVDTIAPVNFESIHKHNIEQTAINNYAFPKE